ncbi:MAG TPA: elongation factor P [Dehalococcoidia bacterium]|jgi:elongation factor P|nr:elongation factor P [Dehalococcoidia bacterium]
MITPGEFKRGIAIELDGKLYTVLSYEHNKVGRGSAQVRLKLRDVRAGHTIDRTFQASEKFVRAHIDRSPMQFLYEDNGLYYFMNAETYDQIALTKDQVGDALYYLKENELVDVLTHGDDAIGVELPTSVNLKVVDTEPGFKGDTATGGNKPAKLETGLTVQVPLFIKEGDVLKVDTRTGEYLERTSS